MIELFSPDALSSQVPGLETVKFRNLACTLAPLRPVPPNRMIEKCLIKKPSGKVSIKILTVLSIFLYKCF